MVAAPGSPGERGATAAVEAEWLKSKGVSNIDDLEADNEPQLLALQEHHQLVVLVEMCQAQRPSKLGSLKGTHEKYEEEFMRLEATVALLAGDGAVEVIKWEPSMPPFPGSGSSSALPLPPPVTAGAAHGRRSRPQSAGAASRAPSRPQSAAPGLRAYMGANGPTSERLGPRIGAFEVCYKLVNTRSGQQYGPVPVFSKISSGKWPGEPAILVKRVQEHLQGFLARDTGNNLMFQHARELASQEQRQRPGSARPKPVLQSAADLPEPEPPGAQDAPAPSAADACDDSAAAAAPPPPEG